MAEDEKKKEQEAQKEDGEDGAQEGEEAEEGGKNKKKMIVIGVVALLFVLAAAGAGVFFLGSGDEEGEEGEHQEELAEPGPKQSFFHEMPDMTVNLAAAGSRFLRLRIVLEVSQEADLAALTEIEPRLVDDFQVYLRELRPEDLRGSAGSYRLRHDLLLRVNQAAQPVVIENVLFKEFLVQ